VFAGALSTSTVALAVKNCARISYALFELDEWGLSLDDRWPYRQRAST
jgi:hypothetical protein